MVINLSGIHLNVFYFFFRQVIGTFPELRNSQKNILDGELLWKYTNLSIMEKIEIAKRLGTSNDQVRNWLLHVPKLKVVYM